MDGKKRKNWRDILPYNMRGGWQNLSFRLLFVVLATFLPLNVMGIVAAGVMWSGSSRELYDAYEREINNGMGGLDEAVAELDENVENLYVENIGSLTLPGAKDDLAGYGVLLETAAYMEAESLEGLVYLYDRQKGDLHIKQSGALQNQEMLKEIEEGLYITFPLPYRFGWHFREFAGQLYYYRYYKCANYNIGMLLDVKANMESTFEAEFFSEKEFYFTDGNLLYRYTDGVPESENMEEWEKLLQKQTSWQVVGWESSHTGMRACLRVEGGRFLSSIPLVYWLLLFLSISFVLLGVLLWRMIKKDVLLPLGVMERAMRKLREGEREFRITGIDEGQTLEMKYLCNAFNKMAQEVQESYEKDIKMVQAQLDNLRLQVNPHMLLNSFNMIYSLAQLQNYECIQDFALYLVDYFRYILKEADDLVTLQKEMKFVESYLGIQRIRFPDTFGSVYNMQEGCEKALVPPLLIENFVENAMKYALKPGEMIEILINARREEDKLLLSVCDTGNGMSEEVLKKVQDGEVYVDRLGRKHIGVWNCRRRMEVFYGGAADMKIVSAPGQGTQIWLELPFLEEEE